MGNILQASSWLRYFDEVNAARLEADDISAIIVYLIDTAPESALYALAWQMDILKGGWKICKGVAEKRELIKSALLSHRRRGTPGSIKIAFEKAGWKGVQVLEASDLTDAYLHTGILYHSGYGTHGGGVHWAQFAVRITVTSAGSTITVDLSTFFEELIEFYQALRSEMVDMALTLELYDTFTYTPTESLSITTIP